MLSKIAIVSPSGRGQSRVINNLNLLIKPNPDRRAFSVALLQIYYEDYHPVSLNPLNSMSHSLR